MSLKLPFAFAAAVLAGAAPAAAAVSLVGYKAVIDLSLAPGAELPGIASLSGRSVTEFSGSGCAGYTTKVRFVTRTATEQGKVLIDDIRGTSFESTDGYFEFENEVYSGEALASRSVGTAVRDDHGVVVELTEPHEQTIDLPADTVFPTEQVMRVVEAAQAGGKFASFPIYDGTDSGETYYQTSTVIGAASTSGDDLGPETALAEAGLATVPHWPVTIGYFTSKDEASEMTPAFTMSLVLYENGITRDLKIDYGPYALVGKLTHLEVLPSEPCPE